MSFSEPFQHDGFELTNQIRVLCSDVVMFARILLQGIKPPPGSWYGLRRVIPVLLSAGTINELVMLGSNICLFGFQVHTEHVAAAIRQSPPLQIRTERLAVLDWQRICLQHVDDCG